MSIWNEQFFPPGWSDCKRVDNELLLYTNQKGAILRH